MDDSGPDIEAESAQHRERARYLRRMANATPARPDRERLLVLAEQYEQLADSV
jgi:hypothetical protein